MGRPIESLRTYPIDGCNQPIKTDVMDEHGNVVRACRDSWVYWYCPKCNDIVTIVGRRSATRVGGKAGQRAPLVRCRRCSYRAIVGGDVQA